MNARAALPYPPLLLSEEAAAANVGLSVTTIRELPTFPRPVRVGRRKLYRYADVQAWALSLSTAGSYDHEWAR
jgi:predicted DNA-binding transcriptional regulator AlpA